MVDSKRQVIDIVLPPSSNIDPGFNNSISALELLFRATLVIAAGDADAL
jgi:hypothetical protein